MGVVSVGVRDRSLEGMYAAEKFRGVGERPALYIIQPKMCPGDGNDIIKIGKAALPAKRMGEYAAVYNNRFQVLHMRLFQRLAYEYVVDGKTSFATRYEDALKRQLAADGVKPLRGAEFFALKDLPAIRKSMTALDKRLKSRSEEFAEKRRSARLQGEQKKYIVDALTDKEVRKGLVHYKVKWQGYAAQTWEPRKTLIEDVPDIVKAFESKRRKA